MKSVHVPHLGHKVVLVPRDQLRFRSHGRRFAIPQHLFAIRSSAPTPPAVFDWSQGEKLTFPILGNDQYGDCYYAAVAHGSQTYTGNNGTEATFNAASVIARYLKIAGGDNGLDDATIMPEWKSGIVGPSGPRKILDEMTVDFRDAASWSLALWAFGGLIWTAALPDNWISAAAPNAVWDNDTANQNNGHAMFLTGRRANGNVDTRTWGISPAIQVTRAGFLCADSEFIVAFSLDQFRADGTCAFTGMSYAAKASLWKSMGGITLPPSPFVDPPTPTPTPPAPTPGPTPPAPHPVAPPGSILCETFAHDVPVGGKVSAYNTPVHIKAGSYGLVPFIVPGTHDGEEVVVAVP